MKWLLFFVLVVIVDHIYMDWEFFQNIIKRIMQNITIIDMWISLREYICISFFFLQMCERHAHVTFNQYLHCIDDASAHVFSLNPFLFASTFFGNCWTTIFCRNESFSNIRIFLRVSYSPNKIFIEFRSFSFSCKNNSILFPKHSSNLVFLSFWYVHCSTSFPNF